MPPKSARGGRQSRAGLGDRLLQDGLSRPASPIRRLDTSVEAPGTYGDGMSTVNYIDVEFERRGGDPENGLESTETIQPFVQDICELCEQIEAKYGFQPSSVRNQRENVLMLVANLYSNIEDDDLDARAVRAVKALHHHTLSSYENWAMKMHELKRADAYGRAGDEDPDTRTLMYEVVLWWCIWGEAANMRFIPEFLSWVFWSLVQKRGASEDCFGRYEDGEGFLHHVMRPMYQYVSQEAFKKDQAGNNCDHSQKNNLDDINEYFWRRRGQTVCTKYNACGEGMAQMIGQLKKQKKTYVERRGLLHSVKSNLRVFTVYICLFHLIVTVAHFVPFEQNSLPLCPPQTRVDSCQGATEEDECKRMSSCDWGNPEMEENHEHCFDSCKTKTKEECTDGCKWDTDVQNPTDGDGSCHMFTSKSSRQLLDEIEQTTYINCDLGTGICRYRDSKNKPVEYSCLQRLQPDEQKKYLALNQGKWWEGGRFGVTGLWDGVPIIGRLTRFFNPPSDESDMSVNRAMQTHMFDMLWAENDFQAKRDLLQKQDQLFTCGFDVGTPDGLMKAANVSYCCNVNLTKPAKDNHGYVQVWSESTSCRWTLLEVFTEEYASVRIELAAVIMTMLACRLLGEVLSWISIWDSALTWWFKLGKVACAIWYGGMLLLLTYVLNSSTEANRENLEHIKQAAHQGYLDLPTKVTLFEVMAVLAMVPELLLGSNSALSAVTKLALACCPRRARECRRQALAMCQPGYVRKIAGRMSSATCSWIKYSLIWVALIWCKCYFSYVFEIRLAVKNEATTWRAIATPFRRPQLAQAGDDAPFWDQFLLKHVQSNDGGVVVAEAVVLLTWIPIFLVFVMDSQIAFSVCQMIVGVWTGVSLRVGHVNSWADFERRLARKLIRKFRINLDATRRKIGAPNAPGGARMSTVDARVSSFKNQAPGSRVPNQGMRGTLLYGASGYSDHPVDTMTPGEAADDTSAFEFKRNAHSFRRFAECWNLFIYKLRYDDYLSDHEASLYKCMVLDSLGSPWLPPLLALDGIANLLDRIDDLEDAHKVLFHGRVGDRSDNRDLWKKDTSDFLHELKANANQSEIREALICAQTLTLFLLKRVTGADGKGQPFEPGTGILRWFHQLEFTSSEAPMLRNLLTDPTKKSAKGARHALIDTIARFAYTVANCMCSTEEGPSKQRGQVFDRTADRGELDLKKIAATTKAVLEQIQSLCEGSKNGDLPEGTIQKVLLCPIFQDDTDQSEVKRIRAVARDREVQRAATYLRQILKVRRVDAVPKNTEALRRILTFASSLHMTMPEPKTVAKCKSLTSFTPFLAEDVLYTREEIMEEKGQASIISYLQTVHPDEWHNLVERLGIAKEAEEAGGTIPEWVWDDEVMATEVRLWASLRGQTLARTVHGVMQVEEGLKLFARQEQFQNDPTGGADAAVDRGKLWQADSLWKRYAHMKFQYVISCQIYGNWNEGENKKKSVDTLMRLFPHLRIAYVKQEPDRNGENKWFSFLVRWCSIEKKVVKCYRIEQAADKGGNGNWGPTWLVGEGKPENQNHAIVFTRGQILQTLDMNQDGYFEEGLKMRNLLEEFTADLGPEGVESKHDHQVRIVGFPEHQFSDTLSAVAEFSALTEFTFATLIQRSLASPFDVRMHYGHPDLFDRVFHVTRGGISKPMKFLCVSEDIFGAFNSVLKGGRVIYREYIKQGKGKDLGFDACSLFEQKISGGNGEQALSRDYARLCEQMGIARLMSFFHSSNGFYWSNVFVIWSTNWFLYGQILISVVIPDDNAEALQTVTESVVFAFQLGMVLTVPLVAELVLEKGPLTALEQMFRVVCRGGPLFFMFHIRTKAYYYDRTLVLGGAGYKATGRGFVLKHTGFVQLFSMFHYSHLNYGMTLFLNLLVYRFFIVDPDSYAYVTWATWLFSLDLLFAPFIFNCLALDRVAVLKDVDEWGKFLWRDDRQVQANASNKNLAEAAKESWRAYFLHENAVYTTVDVWTRLSMICRDLIWVVLPLAILLERNATSTENVSGHFWRATGVGLGTVLVYSLAVLGGLVLLVLFWEELATKFNMCSCRRKLQWRRLQQASESCMCQSRKAKRYALVLISVVIGWTVVSLFMDYGKPLEVVAIYISTFGYLIAFTTNCVFYMGFRPEWLFTVYWVHDAVVGYLILTPFVICSLFRTISDAHMLLLYNQKFVAVLSTMTFDAEVLDVIKRKPEVLKREVLDRQQPTPARPRARSKSTAAVDMEPEPELEFMYSGSPAVTFSSARSINAAHGDHVRREHAAGGLTGPE